MSPHQTRAFSLSAKELVSDQDYRSYPDYHEVAHRLGCRGAAAFYALVHGGPLGTAFVIRYFTKHPVEYIETVMFAIGVAALLLRLADIVGQSAGLGKSPLADRRPARTGQSIEAQCQDFLEQLKRSGQSEHGYYLRRLRAAIQYVWRRGTADGLDDQLKYLADVDVSRANAAMALFRVIVWAVPIMGFLGTVIGITMAPERHRQERPGRSRCGGCWPGLGLKFDTTALALAMSMLLMFVHFFVDRAEGSLLEKVDRRVEEDLTGPLPAASGRGRRPVDGRPPHGRDDVAGDRAAGPAAGRVVAGDRWRRPPARWAQLSDGAAEALKKGLVAALAEGLKAMPSTLRPRSRRLPSRASDTGRRSSRPRRSSSRPWGPCKPP